MNVERESHSGLDLEKTGVIMERQNGQLNPKQLIANIKKLHEKEADEESTKIAWLVPLLSYCGWDTTKIDGRYTVSWEQRNIEGRIDLVLKVDNRIVVCIELKKPSIELDKQEMEKAVKYGAAFYWPVEGFLDPVLTIITNGLEAKLIDISLADPLYDPHKIDLTTVEGVKELASCLYPKTIDRKDRKLPYVSVGRRRDSDPFASARPKKMLEEIISFQETLVNKGYDTERSIEITVYCLLLAAARDNSIIPNSAIRRCLEGAEKKPNESYAKLKKILNKLFGDLFFDIQEEDVKEFWPLYSKTRVFPLRLDVVPVAFIGLLYQKLISKVKNNRTSYYTKHELVSEIISYIKPSIDDDMLDPTCGSGVFLSAAIDYAIKQEIKDHGSISERQILEFFKKIKGVDKDPIACKIAKVSLIMTFMRHVDDSYVRSNKPLPKPKILEPQNYFEANILPVDIILGNPPWDSLDKCSYEKEIIANNKESWQVYSDKNDILCYVLEKAIKTDLRDKGRFGFVIKRQAFYGSSYQNFVRFLDNRLEKLIDYGKEICFLDNRAESVIVCGKRSLEINTNKKWQIERKNPVKNFKIKSGVDSIKFSELYNSCRGAESARDLIYEKYAQEFPNDPCIRKSYSSFTNGGTPKTLSNIAYFFSDSIPSNFIDWAQKTLFSQDDCSKRWITPMVDRRKALKIESSPNYFSCYEILVTRAERLRKNSEDLGWLWDNTQQLCGPILVTDRNLSAGKDKFGFYVDVKREILHRGGKTCISSKQEKLSDLLIFGAILSSKYFIPLCQSLNLASRDNGGIFLAPAQLEKLVLPILTEEHKKKIEVILEKTLTTGEEVSSEKLLKIEHILDNYFEEQKEECCEKIRHLSISPSGYYFRHEYIDRLTELHKIALDMLNENLHLDDDRRLDEVDCDFLRNISSQSEKLISKSKGGITSKIVEDVLTLTSSSNRQRTKAIYQKLQRRKAKKKSA